MNNNDTAVTVVLTSCGRPDLLRRTIESFDQYNTYPVAAKIIIEDGGGEVKDLPDGWVVANATDIKGNRVGQIKAIDIGYQLVKTPYIFHLEDDWEFYAPGFIERSMQVLENERKCICVWLRNPADTNGHPLIMYASKHSTLRLSTSYKWKGFSFNPGLRRLADYKLLAPFSQKVKWDPKQPWTAEKEIGEMYHRMGFYAVIFRGGGYVRHIGAGRHVI
jgi:hypothetical protein